MINNIPNTLPAIEKIISKISVAEKSQQREVRMTIQEARDLTIELALLTSKLNKTVQEINESLLYLKNNTASTEVKFDGGGF